MEGQSGEALRSGTLFVKICTLSRFSNAKHQLLLYHPGNSPPLLLSL